jgi:hypothetical protein
MWPSDGASGGPPSNGMNPALFMSRFGDTHMASIGMRDWFWLKVAGGDWEGCEVSIASQRSFSLKTFERIQVRMSSFMSIPMMILSPIIFHFCISVMRSVPN